MSSLLEELKRYAGRLAQPVFFGESPNQAYSADLCSGSGCFILLGQRVLGVTCHHVLDGYRRKGPIGRGFFQFGPVRFDPETCLLSESRPLDLVTFELTQYLDGERNGIERSKCIEPIRWPPGPIERDDVLAFAGYPGIWRSQPDLGYVRFYSFSSGTTAVDSLGDHHLVTRIQFDECVSDIAQGLVLGSLGGLSGGPVFAWRKTPILIAELIGFITEYQESFDLMYIRRASCISEAGYLVDAG